MYVFQGFDIENDIVIKAGNTADLGAHCKQLKLLLIWERLQEDSNFILIELTPNRLSLIWAFLKRWGKT